MSDSLLAPALMVLITRGSEKEGAMLLAQILPQFQVQKKYVLNYLEPSKDSDLAYTETQA